MTVPLALIVAVARNGVIGAKGDMPWQLPSDLRRFRRLTMGKPVIMGRKTLQSIGRVLDGRPNIVVTRDAAFAFPGTIIAASADEAIKAANLEAARLGAEEILCIGGGEIYRTLLASAQRLYLTRVDAAPDGDTHFPAIDPAVFALAHEEPLPRTERDTANAVFQLWQRRP